MWPKYLGQGEFLRKRSGHDRTPDHILRDSPLSLLSQSLSAESTVCATAPVTLGGELRCPQQQPSTPGAPCSAQIGGQSLQDGPSAALRRGRVLAGDQIAVDDHVWVASRPLSNRC